jgi:hypothetical protein
MQPPITPQVSVPQWLSIPVEVRIKMRKLFSLPRSEASHVTIGGFESKTNSDGHTAKDLSVITLEKLQEFTGDQSSDFFGQLNLLVSQLTAPVETTEAVLKKMNEDKLSKWTAILNGMKQEAQELHLEEELTNLLILAHGKNTPEISKGSARGRRSAKA